MFLLELNNLQFGKTALAATFHYVFISSRFPSNLMSGLTSYYGVLVCSLQEADQGRKKGRKEIMMEVVAKSKAMKVSPLLQLQLL